MSSTNVVDQFIIFHEQAQALEQQVTLANVFESFRQIGKSNTVFLAGGNKEAYIARGQQIHRSIGWRERFFPILDPNDFADCLWWVTEDPVYTEAEINRRLMQIALIQSFKPSQPNEVIPIIYAGIFVTSQGEIFPYTCVSKLLFPFSLWPISQTPQGILASLRYQQKAELFPLERSWQAESIKEFLVFLSKSLTNKSEPQKLTLPD
ncbi:hypothetical protein COY32_01665 [candidate division WWE3 bacterium CG_4_10_14_0_2_um_filter_41_14]|uniref:Uncharacterized protein n=1 Tax=candidate division WWE3 bacterium CG_4_10_14_0_2_um_filter_41_14 TaxID=1975072 RepID=A0A2M7TKP3_UNCKA|nr:MAG: hypothetical protein COY32_01665 [candidate division WWE3 bacterium CG_4_10_14_0_2_um_filter_41_14]